MTEDLKRRLKIIDEENKQEMEKWWDKVLPRKGSLLRQLVDLELNKQYSRELKIALKIKI